MLRRFHFALLLALFAQGVGAGVVLNENYDSQPENARCGGATLTGLWTTWGCDDPTPVTLSGVTHHAGEVTSPGRGGSGKSLKLWRHFGAFGNFTGTTSISPGWAAGISDIYFRFSIRVSAGFMPSESTKLFRFNTTSGSTEVYINMRPESSINASNIYWALYDGNVAGWTPVLDHAATALIMDGNWHSVEIRVALNANVLQAWVDGVLKTSVSRNYSAAGTLNGLGHFPIGNTTTHTGAWQNFWASMEVDDLVIADSYIGPVGGTANPPTVSALTCAVTTLQAPNSTTCTATASESPISYAWTTSGCGSPVRCSPTTPTVTNSTTYSCTAGGGCRPCVAATNAAGTSATYCTAVNYLTIRYVKPGGFTAQ